MVRLPSLRGHFDVGQLFRHIPLGATKHTEAFVGSFYLLSADKVHGTFRNENQHQEEGHIERSADNAQPLPI